MNDKIPNMPTVRIPEPVHTRSPEEMETGTWVKDYDGLEIYLSSNGLGNKSDLKEVKKIIELNFPGARVYHEPR